MWPKYLMDLNAPVWDPTAEESIMDARLRMEMFTVLRDSVNWKKHSSKMDKVIEQDDKMDGQALFRTLENYFGLGKVDGDVNDAGVSLRQCTMQSTGMNLSDYALELQKRLKIVQSLGLVVHVRLELIPMYLKGLLKVHKDIRNTIEDKLEYEPGWNPSLQEVIRMVERRATKNKTMDVVHKGKEVNQNLQDNKNNNNQGGKKDNKKNKKQKKIKQLQAKIKQMQGEAAAPAASVPPSQPVLGQCNFGNKCWRKDCKYQHPAGFKPAPNPKDRTCEECGRSGHSKAECGRCYKCGDKNHKANECPSAAKKFQGSQEANAPRRPVLMKIQN